jgi:hypothetical protein
MISGLVQLAPTVGPTLAMQMEPSPPPEEEDSVLACSLTLHLPLLAYRMDPWCLSPISLILFSCGNSSYQFKDFWGLPFGFQAGM